MAVVQRIQRLYPIAGDQGFGLARPRPAGGQVAPRRLSPGSVCAVSLLAADLVGFCIAAACATLLPMTVSGGDLPAGSPAGLLTASGVGLAGYLISAEHYGHRVGMWQETRDVLRATALALALAAAACFLLSLPVVKVWLLFTAGLLPATVLALRSGARAALDAAGVWRTPVVIVGDGPWAAQAEATMQGVSRLGYDVVGRVSATVLHNEPVSSGRWGNLLLQHGARLVVLAHDTDGQLPGRLIADLVRERVAYAVLPKLDGLPMIGGRHAQMGPETVMVSYSNNLSKPFARAAKMAFDLLAASAALVVLAPVMLVIAAIVGLDGGPVFYAHTRVGVRGRVFRCLKFRSMVTDSDAALQALFARDPAAAEEWKHTHKLRRDPRVTWIGKILRKTSLDELPQLFNVLRLEMSLVGPRPIVSLEIPKYAEDIAYYYETRPGITGLWQVSGRSDTTYAQRVRLDSWYVKNWTIWQDFSIIARTIPAVISGRGAG